MNKNIAEKMIIIIQQKYILFVLLWPLWMAVKYIHPIWIDYIMKDEVEKKSMSPVLTQQSQKISRVPATQKYFNDLTDTVTDIDGNVYHTVKIGTQWWMVENLKTSRYRDGSAITEIEDKSQWADAYKSKKAAWCYYDNNAKSNPTYGKLYNWYAVTDPRGLCPAGWHVPTDEEFKILIDYLGGNDVAGGKMKAVTLWKAPNSGADNSSGFTGLPAGSRDYHGTFGFLGYGGFFWSSSVSAWYRALGCNSSDVTRYNIGDKGSGLSVRCIGD